jgi:hypothetical protein
MYLVNVANFIRLVNLEDVPTVAYAPAAVAALEEAVEHFRSLELQNDQKD